MRSSRSARIAALALLAPSLLTALLESACSPAAVTPPSPPQTPPPAAPDAGATATLPQVSWRLEAPSSDSHTFSVDVSEGKLVLGVRGERWLEAPGAFKPASELVSGNVVGVLKDGDRLAFVTDGHGVFAAPTALGPLTQIAPPRHGDALWAVGAQSAFVVDGSGALLRSTDAGRTYQPVRLPAAAAAIVRDLAAVGRMVAVVTSPAGLYASSDDGATFRAVALPSGTAASVEVDAAALVVSTASQSRYSLDAGLVATVVPNAPKAHRAAMPAGFEPAPVETARAVSGSLAVLASASTRTVDDDSGTRTERVWSVWAGDLEGTPAPRPMDALNGCDTVSVAARGDVVELACDAPGSVEAGITRGASPLSDGQRPRGAFAQRPTAQDGGAPPSGRITKLWRSDDRGATFREDGVVETDGVPRPRDPGLVLGEGGWVLLTERCLRQKSWQSVCGATKVRPRFDAPFSTLADTTGRLVAFASSAQRGEVFALATAQDSAKVLKFAPGEAAPSEGIAVDLRSGDTSDNALYDLAASLDVDESGTVRGAFERSHHLVAFSLAQGSKDPSLLPLPANAKAVSFSGAHAIALTSEGLMDLADPSGRWVETTTPASVHVLGTCSAKGCAMDRGFRVGWEPASSATTMLTDAPATARASRPLACSASGSWTKLGAGVLPSIASTDVGGARWLVATRDFAGATKLQINDAKAAPTALRSLAMMGPGPAAPTWGAETITVVQDGGVVVRRLQYLRKRNPLSESRYNPVDATLAFWRADSDKVHRASIRGLAPFRVNRDPHGGYDGDQSSSPSAGELLALGPKGVHFAVPNSDSENHSTLYLARDDGRVEKLVANSYGSVDARAIEVDGHALLAGWEDDVLQLNAAQGEGSHAWPIHEGDARDVRVVGGRPSLIQTARFFEAPRTWAIALRNADELGEVRPLPTQRDLGATPRACDRTAPVAADALRYVAPWVLGSRHALTVSVDGKSRVLATGSMRVVADAQGSTSSVCARAIEASTATEADGTSQDDDDTQVRYAALLFPDDLAHSLLFAVDIDSEWPQTLSMRPMACAWTDAPLPKSLETVDGFAPPKKTEAMPFAK